jgi:hypothetical protein
LKLIGCVALCARSRIRAVPRPQSHAGGVLTLIALLTAVFVVIYSLHGVLAD